jgi:hypothetical protein
LNGGEPRVFFPDSDEVGSGVGLAQVSPSPSPFSLFLMLGFQKIWGFFISFPDPIRSYSFDS